MIRIALDGMGGDYAPQVVVEGAVMAANDFEHLEIVLVGQTAALKRELNKHKVLGGKIILHEANDIIGMGESPVAALRKKKDSSIGVCIDLLKRKEAAAAVSAGNTGAMVAASTLHLGMLPGIKRPGIAIATPTLHGMSVTVDVGANLNPSAYELFQYAIMADVFAKSILKKKRPSIGLLNIGEEESKGTEVLKETYKLLRESTLNFIGNIEGRDIFRGVCDVVVCEGFVGNVILKLTEGTVDGLFRAIKQELMQEKPELALMFKPIIMRVYRKHDYNEYGGAPLLGINGTALICHGASKARTIRNAVLTAKNCYTHKINDKIMECLSEARVRTTDGEKD